MQCMFEPHTRIVMEGFGALEMHFFIIYYCYQLLESEPEAMTNMGRPCQVGLCAVTSSARTEFKLRSTDGWGLTNAEARCNKSLRPRKPEGSLGRTAQDVHLDSHTAPELCTKKHGWLGF